MSRVFNISSASDAVRLDSHGQGEVAFTVTNASTRPVRGRFKVKLLDKPAPDVPALAADAIAVGGDTERSFNPNDTQQVPVRIKVPSGTREGKYSFRLDGINVDSPDEDFTEGPALAIDVKPTPPKRKFPWWILAIVVLVLLVGGGVGYMIMKRMGMVELPSVTGKPYEEANEQLTALGLVVSRTSQATSSEASENVIAQLPPANDKVKKGSEVVLTVAVAKPVTPTAPVVPADPFAGNWVSKDPNTNNNTRVNIAHAGGVYKVHMFGKCHPQDCDWGAEQASRDHDELNMTWDQGFVVRKMNLRRNGDELIVTTDSVYKDTRPPMHSVQEFVRSASSLSRDLRIRGSVVSEALRRLGDD
jgi:hypothetical protein